MMVGYRFMGEYWGLDEDADKDIFLRKFFLETFRDRRNATTAAWLRAIRERTELREATLSHYEREFRRTRHWAGTFEEVAGDPRTEERTGLGVNIERGGALALGLSGRRRSTTSSISQSICRAVRLSFKRTGIHPFVRATIAFV